MSTYDIRKRALAGQPSYGLVMCMDDLFIPEMAYHAGFHFLRIDCEHTLYDPKTLRTLFDASRNIGIAAQVRIPNFSDIEAILTYEPAGICIPDMDSRAKAEEAADLIKFPPLGKRPRGITRSVRLGAVSRDDFAARGNETLNMIVQIESKEGLEHIDEILSVPGIDMVASGRSDLASSLGAKDRDDPVCLEAEEFIIRKAKEHGKLLTLSVSTHDRLEELLQKGVYCFSIGRDEDLMFKALKRRVEVMKAD